MKQIILQNLRKRRNVLVTGLIALTMTATATTSAFAGNGERRAKLENMSEQERLEHMENKLDHRMEKLTQKLALSDKQAREVRSILSSAQTERLDIRSRHKDDRAAAKPELQALHERTSAELKKVLTADQFAQFEQLKGKHGKKHGKKHGGKQRLERLERELALSPKQVEQIKAIHQARHAEAKEIIAKAGSREAARPELKALRQSSKQEVRALLTAEQQVKFDALKERHDKQGKRGQRGKKAQQD